MDVAAVHHQEVSEVLMEGLYRLLNHGFPSSFAADPAYWEREIKHRRLLIGQALDDFSRRDDPRSASVVRCLHAALAVHHRTGPVLIDYLQRWDEDTERWRRLLGEAPALDDVDHAFDHLRIDAGHR